MEKYSIQIEPTSITPFCKLDLTNNVLAFKGRSSPCSSLDFYNPIIENVDQAFRQGKDTLTANFEFEYFNTSSSKCIYNLLRRLANAKGDGANVIINWFYEEDDDDMRETGEDYEEVLGLTFNYIPV